MKLSSLTFLLFLVFPSIAFAQESYEISRKLECIVENDEIYLERRGERVSERARRKIVKRLRQKIRDTDSKKRKRRLRDRRNDVRDCEPDDENEEEAESGSTELIGEATTCARGFAKQINVFGVRICASENVPDDKLLHTAYVMAEYLDNDEDGNADDPFLVQTMIDNGAFLEMYKNQRDQNTSDIDIPDSDIGQLHYASETFPGQMSEGVFDITLEEVLHLISSVGYHYAYPNDLGENPGSRLTDAMDIARGGRFINIPDNYPSGAWYTYDDETCEYICMASEYFYWALTSLLGAQQIPGRLDEIEHEWTLNTAEKLQSTDTAVYELLTDPQLNLPSVLPDGVYHGGDSTFSS